MNEDSSGRFVRPESPQKHNFSYASINVLRGKKKKSKEYAGAQIHTVLRKLGKCLGGGPEKAKNS